MKLYTKNEIVNKHGQYIAYWSKQDGNNEYEKYKNFIKHWPVSNIEHVIPDGNGNMITCLVDTKKGEDGHSLVCFNNLYETILSTEDCYGSDIESVTESLEDHNII